MSEASKTVPIPHGLPTVRQCPFDPPPELAALRAERPVSPMTYPDGHEGWLVTGYDAVRAVMADPRFSSRPELKHPPVASLLGRENIPAAPASLTRIDPPAHTRYRRLLTGEFTLRQVRRLVPHIERIVEERLDALADAGPPADLVGTYALPIPSLVTCDLLGVGHAHRDTFQHASTTLFDTRATTGQVRTLLTHVGDIIAQEVADRRESPSDDLLGRLVATGQLTDEELTVLGVVLLVAGHETTANMIAMGTYALLAHPRQLASLRADPSLVDNAVEELLRYVTIVHIGPTRVALEDVRIAGRLVRKGQVVTLSLSAANRDPARFPHGDRFDVGVPATGHLAFGHGIHQCLGQHLARAEMRIAFPALLRRFPTLRLADVPEGVDLRTDSVIYGANRLRVEW